MVGARGLEPRTLTRIKWLRDIMVSSTNATITVATAVGHDMHVQDPDLSVNGIRRVLPAIDRNVLERLNFTGIRRGLLIGFPFEMTFTLK
jgi:hypothetical protein